MARGLATYSFDNRAVTEPHNCTCWVVRIHHPVPHICIQVDAPVQPNRVAGQKPPRRRVKVTVRQQQQHRLCVGVVNPLSFVAVWCRVVAGHGLTPGVVGKMCHRRAVLVQQVRGVALRVKLVAGGAIHQQAVRAKTTPATCPHFYYSRNQRNTASLLARMRQKSWRLRQRETYPSTAPTASRMVYVPSSIISIPRARSSLASRRASNTREKPSRPASRTRCSV